MSESRRRPPGGRRLVTRRRVLAGAGAAALAGVSTAGYAVGIEPLRHRVTRYALRLAGWAGGPPLTIALLADLHASDPWMDPARIRGIVADTNALAPDLVLLLGDYVAGTLNFSRDVAPDLWAAELARLSAPLGVHAVLGNHDCSWTELGRGGPARIPPARTALERVGIRVYENDVVRLEHRGRAFRLAGLGDQLGAVPPPERPRFGGRHTGRDDLPKVLAAIPEGAPALLMAHEPDIFPHVPARIPLTVCGHTHGGQVRVLGFAPVVPSAYGERYAYGHIREHTDLLVSGGLGCSFMPVRLGMPPEIVLVDLGGPETGA